MREEHAKLFTPMEIDAIGEILNISLGSSATAISNMLERRVDITTPHVDLLSIDDFEFSSLEPAVGIEITYTKGLHGNNIMLLKRADIKKIVEILMTTEIAEEEFELNDLYISAVCEVMNQMMGASSTALSEFLGEAVNISTPVSFEVEDAEEFKHKYFSGDEPMVIIRFRLKIESALESEFLNMMPLQMAKRIVKSFSFTEMGADAEKEPEAAVLPPEPRAQPEPEPQPQVHVQPEPQVQSVEPKIINARPIISATGVQSMNIETLAAEQPTNLDLIMGVPLQISVEIGRTRKPLKEILDFTAGTLVVLDKLAGEPVDLFVNGQCVARGDVVVVDDSFGVRISEIVKNSDIK